MKCGRFTLARTLVSLSILGLFLLQLPRVRGVTGSLSGSVVYDWVRLLDLFAFAESAVSSRILSQHILYSAAPIVVVYLLLGRAFCGWVCPLDLFFRVINWIKNKVKPEALKRSPPPLPSPAEGGGVLNKFFFPAGRKRSLINFPLPRRGRARVGVILMKKYLLLAGLLVVAALVQFPFFTLYISPLTNFFRTIYAGFYWFGGFPSGTEVFAVAAFLFLGFLALEFFQPRLWCRHLCPVGKTYGLFNVVSLLHVKFNARECVSCKACEDTCYQGVEILSPPGREKVRDSSCILCGRCVEACRTRTKALSLRLGI